MHDLAAALVAAWQLVLSGDPTLVGIVSLSLSISLTAVLFASAFGLPLGAALAVLRFRGRNAGIVIINALMGLPPVVAGLFVYVLLSRSGPLGNLGLLFTPAAMVIAQTVLVTPIVAAIARQIVEDLWGEYGELYIFDGVGRVRTLCSLLWLGRFSLLTAVLAGVGRAVAEVGAILIVGGNIAGVTRTMTTAIALETSRGDLALALGLAALLRINSRAQSAPRGDNYVRRTYSSRPSSSMQFSGRQQWPPRSSASLQSVFADSQWREGSVPRRRGFLSRWNGARTPRLTIDARPLPGFCQRQVAETAIPHRPNIKILSHHGEVDRVAPALLPGDNRERSQ